MASATQMLTKIINAVYVDDQEVRVSLTDGTELYIGMEDDDYNNCSKIVAYYKDDQLEEGSVRDDA